MIAIGDTPTVCVTGASGYIGSRVSLALLKAGYKVYPIDDFSNGSVRKIDEIPIKRIDITNRSAVRTALEKVDAVCHLAAISGVKECSANAERAFDVNVGGTENVAWICREQELPLVFAGSVAVCGEPTEFPITADHPRNPTSYYGRTKQMSEEDVHHLATDAFPSHVLLKSNLYGVHEVNGKHVSKDVVINIFVNQALAGEPLTVHEPGTQTFDFVHVTDVARSYVDSVETLLDAEAGAETLMIGSGEEWSVRELANLVQQAAQEERGLDVQIKYVESPRGDETTESKDFTVETSHARKRIGFVAQRDVESVVRTMLQQN